MRLITFESTYMFEEPENGIITGICIDGYPADENEEGNVVAKVIKTKSGDIATVFTHNGYRNDPLVLEEIKHAITELQNHNKNT